MTTAPPTNLQIAALLNEYATLLELRGESAYRTIAYRRGAEAIAELDHPAANQSAAELQEIEGIGKTISSIVREISTRGSFRALDEVRQILPSTLTRFLELPGVGVKTALRLYEGLGVATLDQLREAAASGKIAATKGWDRSSNARSSMAWRRSRSTRDAIASRARSPSRSDCCAPSASVAGGRSARLAACAAGARRSATSTS
ncbi:MAG: helix-hairpin-helix domain-containing protein [Thermomicrobiales bacterium]